MRTAGVVLALVMIGTATNLLRNGNFERFSGGEPAGWTTNNIPGMLVLVSQSSLRQSGNSGVRCEVKDSYGTKIAGMIRQENIAVGPGELSLKGVYLLKAVGKDAGFVNIDVKGTGGSTIATCEQCEESESAADVDS